MRNDFPAITEGPLMVLPSYADNMKLLVFINGQNRDAWSLSEGDAKEVALRYNAFPALVEALEFCRSKIGQPNSIEIKDDLEKIDSILHSLKSEG